MARVPLSQLTDWNIVNESQEIRGLRLEDGQGRVLGLITDLIVDQEAGYVDAILLDTGKEVSADDIDIGNNVVFLRGAPPQELVAPVAPVERVESLRLPVVEESLRIGKRQYEGGGVRVTTEVKDVPVHQAVPVRHEVVGVQRAPVHRLATADEIGEAFREGTLEVRARAQYISISKQLYVVEEIRINKAMVERTETIQDSVRRMHVQIEALPDQGGRERPSQQQAVTREEGANR